MTQETFGNKLNANGKTMKKKQMWILEGSGDGATVCLKSHLGKYLIVDKFGNVTCNSEEKEENTNPKFEMSIMGDKSGRIAFKSMSRGRFLICDNRYILDTRTSVERLFPGSLIGRASLLS